MRVPLSAIVILPILAEIATFIAVGKAIGVLSTLGLVLLGIVTGIVLLRRQGVVTLRRIHADIRADAVPAQALADGAVKAVAALLLILPGFLSDLLAITLFVPQFRAVVWKVATRGGRFAFIRPRGQRTSPQHKVVDLDRTEYGTRRASRSAAVSPWRSRPGGTTA
jgi:UPF0716 protein FxsA